MNVTTYFETTGALRAGRAPRGSRGRNALSAIFTGAVTAVALLFAGCAHLDTTPPGNPDRMLTGAVNFNGSLPAGAEVLVRVVEPPSSEPARATTGDLPVAAQPAIERVERVLGEGRQVLSDATTQPVPFRVEYRADDAQLRRGLNVDVRVSVGGKVRMRTVNAHAITSRSAEFKQEVWVQPVQ